MCIRDRHKVTQGPVGQQLLAKLEPKGIRGLAYWDNGFKSFSLNSPIKLPADLKGKKMRIQSSKVLEAQMRALGSLPQVMAFSEVYQALQTGVVDGTENPISNLYTQKMYEVQKHLSLTDHGYLGYAVIVNKKFWDGLPADVRGQLETAMKDSTAYANKIAKEQNDKDLEAVRKSGKTAVYVPVSYTHLDVYKRQALLNWIRCVMSGMTTSGFRRAVGQPRDAEDGGEQGSAHRPGKLPEREQKPLTSPPFCSDLLTELLSCRFWEICCAVCRTALPRIKWYGINIHLINYL